MLIRQYYFVRAPAWGLLGLLVACSSSGGTEDLLLTSSDDWAGIPEGSDPFWADDSGQSTVVCGEQDWHAEDETVEINTTECNYVTLSQPLPVSIKKGDIISFSAWWQTLASEETALAHIEVRIGTWSLLNEQIAIPADADARDLEVAAPKDLASGTPIYFHVHNHGFNSWTLGALTLTR